MHHDYHQDDHECHISGVFKEIVNIDVFFNPTSQKSCICKVERENHIRHSISNKTQLERHS